MSTDSDLDTIDPVGDISQQASRLSDRYKEQRMEPVNENHNIALKKKKRKKF